MISTRVSLESFENEDVSEPAVSEDYQRGFADGKEMAEQSHNARLAQATEALSATLSDMTFGFTEARVQLLDHIRPLMTQIAEAVVPLVLGQAFLQHLIDVLDATFVDAVTCPIEIRVPEDLVDPLRNELADHADAFSFSGDSSLQQGQAIIVGPTSEIMLDLPSLTLELQTALNGLEPLERTYSHG